MGKPSFLKHTRAWPQPVVIGTDSVAGQDKIPLSEKMLAGPPGSQQALPF